MNIMLLHYVNSTKNPDFSPHLDQVTSAYSELSTNSAANAKGAKCRISTRDAMATQATQGEGCSNLIQ